MNSWFVSVTNISEEPATLQLQSRRWGQHASPKCQ